MEKQCPKVYIMLFVTEAYRLHINSLGLFLLYWLKLFCMFVGLFVFVYIGSSPLDTALLLIISGTILSLSVCMESSQAFSTLISFYCDTSGITLLMSILHCSCFLKPWWAFFFP